MIVVVASHRVARFFSDGLERLDALLCTASAQKAEIACFPEAYLPGLRGQDFDVFPWDEHQEKKALDAVGALAAKHRIAVIMGMEHASQLGRQIVAAVID